MNFKKQSLQNHFCFSSLKYFFPFSECSSSFHSIFSFFPIVYFAFLTLIVLGSIPNNTAPSIIAKLGLDGCKYVVILFKPFLINCINISL